MGSNAEEWCADWFDDREYQRRAKSTVKDPQGPKTGMSRVLRGGWDRSMTRCAFRHGEFPDHTGWYRPIAKAKYFPHEDVYGFRVCVVSQQD